MNAGQFKKGNVPHNKGKRNWWKPVHVFEKGNLPHSYRPIGSERISAKDGYIYVKVADPCEWRLKSHIVWEQHNGKIPKSCLIRYLDNNNQNTDIDNLICVTQCENAILNKIKFAEEPAELKRVILASVRLKAKIGQMDKNNASNSL